MGVDPGASGAIAFIRSDGSLGAVHDMPTVDVKSGKSIKRRVSPQALARLTEQHEPTHAFVERVGAMPGQGVSSMFAFGYSAGLVEGVLSALKIGVTMIAPAAWKRAAGLTADKGHARQRAMQIWPEHAALFARVKDDGRAEAALLALHGLRSHANAGREMAA